ncbi:MAG: hypothetical protein LBV20_06240 [Treponema sp.]|jgi:hypothetical protein|nr:hypothetical protein [Treponema sp.]
MMFSSGASSYQVIAYVVNPDAKSQETQQISRNQANNSENSNSIIKTGDALRPDFLRHIEDDPDLTGLLMYMEDSAGIMVGDAVHYSLLGRNSSEQSGVLVTIDNFNDEFPDFPLPEDLPIGQYTLVFNVLGGDNILYQSTQTMYYISESIFSLDGIQTYLPGVSEVQPIPPSTTILLESVITSDNVLDPYIIWYNEGKPIGEGRLSEHYHHILWTVPEQSDFYSIEVEVFPFVDGDKPARDASGFKKRLSLFVDSKAALPSFEENSEDALYWYQFAGNVEPSKNSARNDAVLVKTQESPPRWEPLSDVYGLLIGENDIYDIPDFSVVLNNENDAEYDLYTLNMRFAPKNEGTLFRGSFETDGSNLSELILELVQEKDGLALSIQNDSVLYRESILIDLFTDQRFIVTALNFYSFNNTFFAYLELENPLLRTEIISLPYKGVLSGEGTFSFGTKQDEATEVVTDELVPNTQGVDIAIIDDFILKQSRQAAEF